MKNIYILSHQTQLIITSRLYLSIICLCLATASGMSFTQNEVITDVLDGVAIQSGANITAEDPRYGAMQSGAFDFINLTVNSRILLQINTLALPQDAPEFTTSVDLTVNYEQWTGSSFVTVSENIVLEVDYKKTGAFKDQAIYRLFNAHQLDVTVNSITGPVEQLSLSGIIAVDRVLPFDAFSVPAGLAGTLQAERGELEVTWQAISGAEYYDLEWTWINNYSQQNGQRLTPDNITVEADLFRRNSSRISVKDLSYGIPLIYDRGYIVYRVRATGFGGELLNKLVAGNWTYVPMSGQTLQNAPNSYEFAGHQGNLNWQATVSYAEEGKNKAAVSYFDGSLRNRQVVSRLNTEDKIIVGETVYDHQGRGALQVLPVPENKAKVGYQENFNQNQAGQVYSRSDFDLDTQACEVQAAPMSANSGAEQYYSPNNPDQAGVQAYLPRSEGYPFTQIEYTPDNTGRIRRQSGVGPTHQLGTTHETRYFYLKPNQEELDRLFGSEVGDSKHYKKNMVIDANGQVSVSYLDPQGRVVATALAGSPPEQLDNIFTAGNNALDVRLIQHAFTDAASEADDVFSTDGRSRRWTSEIGVTDQSTRNFTYTLETTFYSQECQNNKPLTKVCYDCVVDVSFHLTDECGNELLVPQNGGLNVTIGEASELCDDQGTSYTNAYASAGPLEQGAYQLSRTITINEEALQNYTNSFIANADDCVTSFDFFLQDEATQVEIFDCEADCEVCRESVGEYSDYVDASGLPSISVREYNDLLAQCDFLCDEDVIQCSAVYTTLLTDLSPFGQYGELIGQGFLAEDGNPISSGQLSGQIEFDTTFALSIFNVDNRLPLYNNQRPSWRTPLSPAGVPHYQNEDGTESFIKVLVFENDGAIEYIPNILPEARPADPVQGQVIEVKPQQLASVVDFIANWQSQWAEQLVIYHPEYCYYEFCGLMESSHAYDTRMINATTIEQAIEEGFLTNQPDERPNPVFSANPELQDPYYLVNVDDSRWLDYDLRERLIMNLLMSNYPGGEGESIWSIVHRTVNCPFDDGTLECGCPDDDGINTDEEWNTFTSMYYSLKQHFYERKMTFYAIDNRCYNGYIGEGSDDPFQYAFYGGISGRRSLFDILFGTGPYGVGRQDRALYEEKNRRFTITDDALNIPDADLSFCYPEIDENSDPETLPDPVACAASLNSILAEQTNKVDFQYYETCGQCPLALDLELLFNAVAGNERLDVASTGLSCYPTQSDYPEFTKDLSNALEEVVGTAGSWVWNRVSGNGNTLGIALTNDAGSCQLDLKIVNEDASWSEIVDICCINYTEGPQIFEFESGTNFFVKGTKFNTNEKVLIEGKIGCLDIGSCTFAPVCEKSQSAEQVQFLLNALTFDFDLDNSNAVDLTSTAPVALDQDPYATLNLNLLRDALDSDLTSWQGTNNPSSGVLSGTITSALGGSCVVELRTPGGEALDYTQLIGFEDIRPNSEPAGVPIEELDEIQRHFKVTALVRTEVGRVKVRLNGYTSCVPMSSCENLEPGL